MSGPVYGGFESLNDPGARKKGIYAEHPAATPKYNASTHTQATLDSQARMYIEIPSQEVANRIIDALPPRAQAYANAFLQVQSQISGRVYMDFLLQTVNEPLQEKVQVSEMLSDSYVAFFFGQRAPVWSYGGVVLNTQQDQWYDAWHILYYDLIRGTRTSEIGYPVVLQYDTRRVIGSIMAQNTSFSAQNELFASLQFQLLVKELQFSPDIASTASEFAVTRFNYSAPQYDGPVSFETAMTDTIDEQHEALIEIDEVASTLGDIRPGSNLPEVARETQLNYFENIHAQGPVPEIPTVKLAPDRKGPGGATM